MFHGRAKNVVKSGGYSVYPLEVEADLEEHPDVLEAAVVGLADRTARRGARGGGPAATGCRTTPDELLAWAAERMAHYKAPRRVVVVDELPRTGTRKVQRDQLLPLFAD